MKKAGLLYIPDDDTFFGPIFERTGDRFDDDALGYAIECVKQWCGDYMLDSAAIDVGAHVGSWSRVMAEHFGNVLAFEPSPDNHECLVENTKDINNIEALNAAVGDSRRMVNLEQGNNPGNSGTWHEAGIGDLPMVALDDMGIEGVALIKIDVEGSEYFTLKGAMQILETDKPVLIIEQNELSERYGKTKADVDAMLVSLGYAIRARFNKDYVYDHVSRW